LLLLIATFFGASYNSSVQTVFLKQYIKTLSKNLNTTINIQSIDVSFFSDLTLKGLYVEDLQEDTLLYIDELRVDIDKFSYKEKIIKIDQVSLDNMYLNIQQQAGDSISNISFILDYFASDKADTTKSEWNFAIDKLQLKDAEFIYDDYNYEPYLTEVDYDHIGISYLNLSLSDIQLLETGVAANINQLSLFEKEGFQIDNLTAKAKFSSKGIITKEFNLLTPNSKIKGDIAFLMKDFSGYDDFIHRVDVKTRFDSSLVSFRDICHFAPSLYCLDKSLIIDGKVTGRIDNLRGRDLKIKIDDGTVFRGDADISGIPETDNMFYFVNVKQLTTSKHKIEQIPLFPFSDETFVELPDNFRDLGVINFKGKYIGFHHDFVANGKFNTALGYLETDVKMKLTDNNITKYSGSVIAKDFNLGKFLDIPDEMGEISMNVGVDGEGFSLEELKTSLTGNVKSIVLENYEYNNIEVKGDFQDKKFNGYLAVEDENVSFDFDGSVDLTGEKPQFHFISNIKDAKLGKLNLIKSKKKLKTRYSTTLKVDLIGDHIDNLKGKVEFVNSNYKDNLDSIYIPNTTIIFDSLERGKLLTVSSEILDVELQGEYNFGEITSASQYFFNKYIPSAGLNAKKLPEIKNDFNFNVQIHHSKLLSKTLINGIDLGDESKITGMFNSNNQSLAIDAMFPNINIYGVKMDSCLIKGETRDSTVYLNLKALKLYANDSLYVNGFQINTQTHHDSLLSNISWKNEGDLKTEANLNISTYFEGFDKLTNTIFNSHVYIDDLLWKVNPHNLIVLDTTGYSISNLSFKTKSQGILLDGKISKTSNDQLDVLLSNYDLGMLRKIIPQDVALLEGVVNGTASFRYNQENLIFTSDLDVNKFRFNDNSIGDGSILSAWDNDLQTLSIDGKFFKGHIPSISFKGNYFPSSETQNFDIDISLQRTDIEMFNVYTEGVVDDLKGIINGNVKITGTVEKPELNGLATLKNTSFLVTYLNTKYSTPLCKINITPDMISFDNVSFYDEKQSLAKVNGTVFHDWFSDWSYDVGMEASNFFCLNTTSEHSNIYYGKIYASGFVNLGGYEDQIYIDIDMKSNKNSELNIPLTDEEEIEENSFIEFVSKDALPIEDKIKEEIDFTNIQMDIDLEITKDVNVRLIFDEQVGDVLKCTGYGDINLGVNPQGEFNIYGQYQVLDGDYLFTLQNVINKRFDIESGGTISWDGDPYAAIIDVTAIYRTRARLYELVYNLESDSTSAERYKKRVPVDLKLKMSNAMMNPDIKFDFDLPTADESTRSKVRSVLYLSGQEENVQELNRQVFSLLVLNQFLPPPDSDLSGGYANAATANSSELLSNQLSNWLSKISNDFDIGVNYRPGDEITNQELEVALSTQIFNDRLTIDGNFGFSDKENISSQAEQQASTIIDDVSIEYKITEDGAFRLKAFNTSNQYSLEETNALFTQGIGVFYKEEYDSGKEFFQKLFNRFKKSKK